MEEIQLCNKSQRCKRKSKRKGHLLVLLYFEKLFEHKERNSKGKDIKGITFFKIDPQRSQKKRRRSCQMRQPTPVFLLDKPIDIEAWQAIVLGVTKNPWGSQRLQQLSMHIGQLTYNNLYQKSIKDKLNHIIKQDFI